MVRNMRTWGRRGEWALAGVVALGLLSPSSAQVEEPRAAPKPFVPEESPALEELHRLEALYQARQEDLRALEGKIAAARDRVRGTLVAQGDLEVRLWQVGNGRPPVVVYTRPVVVVQGAAKMGKLYEVTPGEKGETVLKRIDPPIVTPAVRPRGEIEKRLDDLIRELEQLRREIGLLPPKP